MCNHFLSSFWSVHCLHSLGLFSLPVFLSSPGYLQPSKPIIFNRCVSEWNRYLKFSSLGIFKTYFFKVIIYKCLCTDHIAGKHTYQLIPTCQLHQLPLGLTKGTLLPHANTGIVRIKKINSSSDTETKRETPSSVTAKRNTNPLQSSLEYRHKVQPCSWRKSLPQDYSHLPASTRMWSITSNSNAALWVLQTITNQHSKHFTWETA